MIVIFFIKNYKKVVSSSGIAAMVSHESLVPHKDPSCLTNESSTEKTKFVGTLSFGSRLEDFKDIILRDGDRRMKIELGKNYNN